MWLWKQTTKVRSLTQQPLSSNPWAGHQPHMSEHPPSLLTQRGGSQRAGSFHPSPHCLLIGRWCPSHAICGEVGKEGRTAGERHEVRSKTEGLKTLGALRREDGSPGFKAQWLGFGPLLAKTGTVLGLACPIPGTKPHASAPWPHPYPSSADPPS